MDGPNEAGSHLNDVKSYSATTPHCQEQQLQQVDNNHLFRNIDVRMKRHPELQPYVPSDRDRRPDYRRPNQALISNTSDVKFNQKRPKKCVSMTRLDQLAQPKRLFTKTAKPTTINNSHKLTSTQPLRSPAVNNKSPLKGPSSRPTSTIISSNATSTPTSMVTASSNSANTSATASLTPSTTSASISTSISKSKLKEEEEREEQDREDSNASDEFGKEEDEEDQKKTVKPEPKEKVELDRSISKANDKFTEQRREVASNGEHVSEAEADILDLDKTEVYETEDKVLTPNKVIRISTYEPEDSLQFSTPCLEPRSKEENGQQQQQSQQQQHDQDEEKRLKAEEELREASRREEEERQNRQLKLDSILSKLNLSA